MENWIRNKLERKRMEPEPTFTSFRNHWVQAVDKMQSLEESQYSESALAVISNMAQMIALLRVARDETPGQSCKGFWIQNQCSDRVLNWLHDLKNKGLQLSHDDDERLVKMLYDLCQLASRDGEVLGYVRANNDAGAVPWDGACSLASLLLEYSLENEQELGENAKDSFIRLIQLASRFPALEKSLSQESGIGYTNLVISGLCACFAQLPTYAHGNSEQMRPFVRQLKFVDDISHAAPQKVATAIADCFSTSFLNAIIKSALTQDEGNHSLHKRHDSYVTSIYEEEAVVTRYLQTMCELLTHPLLVQRLMEFVISMSSTFLPRLNHPNVSVTVSTLSLFNSLLNFYCEDLWFHVVLKYLLHQNHRMGQLRKTPVTEIDFHDSSVRFLRLIPKCIIEAVGQEKLTHHYVQYLNSESKRLASLDSIGLGFLTPTSSPSKDGETFANNIATSTNTNPIYPRWKLKYDGTDDIKTPEASPKNAPLLLNGDGDSHGSDSSSLLESEISLINKIERTNDMLTAVVTKQKIDPDDLNDSSEETVFTTVSLHQTGVDDLSSIGLSEQSFDSFASGEVNRHVNVTSDELSSQFGVLSTEEIPGARSGFDSSTNNEQYSLMSNGKGLDAAASFGPFLDSLLQHLANMTLLDPDVILIVTEILSLVAASRIPLVNSLFLDPALIIQPSYPSFASLLNRIQSEFDQALYSHAQLIQEVWTSMTRERKSSTSSTSSYTSNFDDTVSVSSRTSTSSVTDNFRNKMLTGAKMAAKGFSLLGFKNPNTSNTSLHQQSLPESQESLHSLGGQGYMYTNNPSRTQSPLQTPNDPVKVMATRAIFFTHWLLELAAISQQLCWKRT